MAHSKHDLTLMSTPQLAAVKESPFPDLTAGNGSSATTQEIRHNRAAHLSQLRHLYPIPGPIPDQVKETFHDVPTRDNASVRVKVYTPIQHANADQRPLIVMMHEGGWSMGDLTDEDLNCRLFSRDLGAVCVNVEYRLAPEHPFPTGVHDCQDVVRWCARTASSDSDILPANPRQDFIVGGASAGGNLAAVMCQLSRDEHLDPPLTGQYLCVPALLSSDAVPEKWKAEYQSRFNSKDDPVLQMSDSGTSRSTKDLKPDTHSPLFLPLLHPELKGLPPAYFQLGGLDPLRDEGLLYERVLREEAGVRTKIDVYDGYGHMFWTNWPTMQRSREFVDDTLSGMKWLLEQKSA